VYNGSHTTGKPAGVRSRVAVVGGIAAVIAVIAAASAGVLPSRAGAAPSATSVTAAGCPTPKPTPTVTKTVAAPGPTETVTAPGPTETVTAPGPTATTTAPGPTQTVTETVTPIQTVTTTPPVTATPTITVTISAVRARAAGCAPTHATQHVSLRVSSHAVVAGQTVVFTGTVRPHHHGFVELQSHRDGRWHVVRIVRLDASGHYSVKSRARAGREKLRIVALSSSAYTRAVSKTVTVAAAPTACLRQSSHVAKLAGC
jgi:hypothetical protein